MKRLFFLFVERYRFSHSTVYRNLCVGVGRRIVAYTRPDAEIRHSTECIHKKRLCGSKSPIPRSQPTPSWHNRCLASVSVMCVVQTNGQI